MSTYIYNWIPNFNEDENMSKELSSKQLRDKGAFKKGKPHAIKGMGPNSNFDIKNFWGELSKHI